MSLPATLVPPRPSRIPETVHVHAQSALQVKSPQRIVTRLLPNNPQPRHYTSHVLVQRAFLPSISTRGIGRSTVQPFNLTPTFPSPFSSFSSFFPFPSSLLSFCSSLPSLPSFPFLFFPCLLLFLLFLLFLLSQCEAPSMWSSDFSFLSLPSPSPLLSLSFFPLTYLHLSSSAAYRPTSWWCHRAAHTLPTCRATGHGRSASLGLDRLKAKFLWLLHSIDIGEWVSQHTRYRHDADSVAIVSTIVHHPGPSKRPRRV